MAVDAATIEFIRGVEEPSVPDVRLTRSKDGGSGTATFVFAEPSIFEASSELGDITVRKEARAWCVCVWRWCVGAAVYGAGKQVVGADVQQSRT